MIPDLFLQARALILQPLSTNQLFGIMDYLIPLYVIEIQNLFLDSGLI